MGGRKRGRRGRGNGREGDGMRDQLSVEDKKVRH